MENVVVDIPNIAFTQSGSFVWEVPDKNYLLSFVANNVANYMKEISYKSYNNFLTNASLSKTIEYKDFAEDLDFSIVATDKYSISNSSYTFYCNDIDINWGRPDNVFTSVRYRQSSEEQRREVSRVNQINKAFENELLRFGSYISGGKDVARLSFRNISLHLGKIKFQDFVVELAPSNSFKVKILLPDEKLLVVTKPLNMIDDLTDDEVIFSLFEGKKCLISDAKNIVELVKGINDYLDSK